MVFLSWKMWPSQKKRNIDWFLNMNKFSYKNKLLLILYCSMLNLKNSIKLIKKSKIRKREMRKFDHL